MQKHMPRQPAALVRPRPHRSLTLLALCCAVLIAQLDTSVVNLALRPIGEDFAAPVSALQWVIDSYNLLYAVLLLTGGLLADLYGRRVVFMAGAALFSAASLLCAAAPAVSVLILGRALAGVGAALLLPASLAIIRVVWPDERSRGRALGVWAGCNGVAFAIGPTIGGLLIAHFGWRSIFLIVVPVGLAAIALALAAIPESSDPQRRSFDAPAQALGAVALGGLAVAAIESHANAGMAMLAFGVAAAALAVFVRAERARGPAALVPLAMFGVRPFRGAIAATSAMTFGMYGMLFLLPLVWLGSGRLDPVGAGVALMPMALVFVAVSLASGPLTSRFGVRVTAAGGVGIISLGLFTLALAGTSGSLVPIELGLGLTGLGMGFATGPLMGAAVGAVSAARSGTAAALINVARMAGATVGVAILGTLFAVAGGGEAGFRLAMLAGAVVQLAGSMFAAASMTTGREPRDMEQHMGP